MIEDAEKKLKAVRAVVIVAVVIMTVMAVVIIMDNVKLLKIQNVYNDGYNKCAQLCNIKLNFYKERCASGLTNVPDSIPTINESQIIMIPIS